MTSEFIAEFFEDLDRRIDGTHPQPTPEHSREFLATARPKLRLFADLYPDEFERVARDWLLRNGYEQGR